MKLINKRKPRQLLTSFMEFDPVRYDMQITCKKCVCTKEKCVNEIRVSIFIYILSQSIKFKYLIKIYMSYITINTIVCQMMTASNDCLTHLI